MKSCDESRFVKGDFNSMNKEQKFYKMNIAGLDRYLPICPLNDSLQIAGFVIFGDPELTTACAKELLDKAGHAANVREINAFAVPDVPGGLAKVLNLLETNGVNIEYMYALITSEAGKAYTVMRTDNTEATDKLLAENDIEVLDEGRI